MAVQTVTTAVTMCTFGVAPSTFVATPRPIMTSYMPVGVVTDNIPMVNIMPFGMCTSLANPTVASATSAAAGVLTPMPCIPVTPSPWAPGSVTHMITFLPALNNTSKLMCTWGGVISITFPGQTQELIP